MLRVGENERERGDDQPAGMASHGADQLIVQRLLASSSLRDARRSLIGSGIAGLRAAISLADAGRVIILTKADPGESNTGYAQGGIAAAVGTDDEPRLHFEDTLVAGAGLGDPVMVAIAAVVLLTVL